MKATLSKTSYFIVNHCVWSTFESEAHCIGSLVIGHEDELGFVMSVTLEGPRSYYKNLKRRFPVLRQNTVTHIETIGNCC